LPLGNFIVRVHSLEPLSIRHVPALHMETQAGEWRRSGDSDTTGGPLYLNSDNGSERENAKWCQNPQIHFQLKDVYADEELHFKIVVRRTDKLPAQKANPLGTNVPVAGIGGNEKSESHIGMALCKAEVLEDSRSLKRRGHEMGPRKNAYGEVWDLGTTCGVGLGGGDSTQEVERFLAFLELCLLPLSCFDFLSSSYPKPPR